MPEQVAGRRVRRVLLPAGTQVGGSPVDTMTATVLRTEAPLVRLGTAVGQVTAAGDQRFQVRRRGLRPGEPFGEPQWLAACTVRPGDFVRRPAGKGQPEWFEVNEVAHLLPTDPLYAIDTDADTLVVNGFLAEVAPTP